MGSGSVRGMTLYLHVILNTGCPVVFKYPDMEDDIALQSVHEARQHPAVRLIKSELRLEPRHSIPASRCRAKLCAVITAAALLRLNSALEVAAPSEPSDSYQNRVENRSNRQPTDDR